MLKRVYLLLIYIMLHAAQNTHAQEVFVSVLGTVQDAGSPHIGCSKRCCTSLIHQPDSTRKVVALGITDAKVQKNWLIEATPDIAIQMRWLIEWCGFPHAAVPDGIFVTHAHIGHYSGLMYLGREAMHAKQVPVYVLPRMKQFLEQNGPWSQLVSLQNISLKPISANTAITLSANVSVKPVLVPHRDEYSETVGFSITGPDKSLLFIPDIDKWNRWYQSLTEWISRHDYVLIDATFYDATELNNRNMAEIPHPFVVETMELLKSLTPSEKSKIHLIHMNHTNPLLNPESEAYRFVISSGFRVAHTGIRLKL